VLAQVNLGNRYAFGRGVARDPERALYWYRRAAEQGDASAQNNLGVMYANGQGVRQDDAQAVHWYRLAAEQGHALAQYNLGGMLGSGRGAARDPVRAYMWMLLAADAGEPAACAGKVAIARCLSGEQIGKADELRRRWRDARRHAVTYAGPERRAA
jgi:TPR repeat protein